MTDVEQEEMDKIIADGIKDAKKSGVECKIEKKVMSFYSFVQEYGEPYGVSVESLLAQASAEAVVREHGTPEPQPEVSVARSESKPTADLERPQPEPEVDVSAGANAASTTSDTSTLHWLQQFKLESYADAIVDAGGDDLIFLIGKAANAVSPWTEVVSFLLSPFFRLISSFAWTHRIE